MSAYMDTEIEDTPQPASTRMEAAILAGFVAAVVLLTTACVVTCILA